MKNVMFILDGFAYEYVENDAFAELKDFLQFIIPMKPSAGWSSKPVLFTGNGPRTNDLFTQYWLSENSQFKWLKINRRIWLPPMFSAFFTGFFRKLLSYKILPNTRIPLNALQYFDVSDGYVNALKIKQPVGLEKEELKIVYTKIVDRAGHLYGTQSTETCTAIEKVSEIIRTTLNVGNFDNLFVVGDHGMCDIKKKIDIVPALDSTGLKFGKDLLYFIDSTMIRFWFVSEHSKEVVTEVLEGFKKFGKIIGTKDAKELDINFGHKRYGELVFWLNDGVVFKPSFYHRWTFTGARKNEGMHGYLGDRTVFAVASKRGLQFKRAKEAEMTSFYPTVMETLGKEYKCEGKSLLR
ncbi:hypothetical protein E2P64_00615 [Candidatus Bathyarchaeota archaeon]|nr:hypothetical protein E2P64_00615 [Candidatus Bathyarchaeota archaeon]